MVAIGKNRHSMPVFLKILFVFCSVLVCIRESSAELIKDEKGGIQYLQKFGYLDKPAAGVTYTASSQTVIDAVAKFQKFAELSQSGTFDQATLAVMNSLRCGNKDVQNDQIRRKPFFPQGNRWASNLLTYRISKLPSSLYRDDVREIFAKAFKAWSDVADLNFVERTCPNGDVNIDIRFETRNHGNDSEVFDGAGSVYGHAFSPIYGGAIHFDNEENWNKPPDGPKLLPAAVHEIGHALGLEHSYQKQAAMSPFYNYFQKNLLNQDDIAGIQIIYGPKTGIQAAADLCRDSSIQAITMLQNGEVYAFKGEFYWRVLLNGIAGEYPRRITEDWSGLPGNLDAALTLPDGRTFFFKDDKYWCFQNRRREAGFPKLISEGFPEIPNNLDAAVVWSGNDRIYFFKGSYYWQFDQVAGAVVKFDYKYPYLIKDWWPGIPDNVDAGFLAYDNQTYFFKEDKYYKFYSDKVVAADPPYPRLTSQYWFGCSPDLNPPNLDLGALNIVKT